MTEHEDVDIAIIHLNGERVIENCLSSIFANDRNARVNVLFNNTSDNSIMITKNKFPLVKRYISNKTLGFAAACNFLVRKASTKYVVLLNNDVVVEKNWISEMVKIIKRNKNCVACQSKILSYNERKLFEYAGAGGGFIDIYGFPFCRGRIFSELEEDNGQYNDEIRVFWACGVCMLVDRNFFIDIGGFDEELFMYAEELDFCWRANLLGKKIYYSPKSVIYHVGNFSIGKQKVNHRKEYLTTRNHLIVLLKNYSLLSLVKILPIRVLLEFVAAIRFPEKKAMPFLRCLFSVPYIFIIDTRKKRRATQISRKVSDRSISEIMLNKSIAFQHYINGINKFSELSAQ